ncbi:MAG: SurA N-terminal domain-containing protein [bacterium]
MLMKVIRKNIKVLLWITAIMFILGVFLFQAASLFTRRNLVVAKVNRKKISIQEYSKTLNETLNTYRNIYKMDITEQIIPQIRKSVLNGMIQIHLMTEYMKKHDIEVSDKAVIDKIRKTPAFKKNDRFDRELYLERLGSINMTPQVYEGEIRNSLKSEKISRLMTAGVKVTTPELREEYKKRKYNPELEQDTFEARKSMMADSLSMQKQNLYYQDWLQSLKAKADIEDNLLEFYPAK